MKGQQQTDVSEIQQNMTSALRAIPSEGFADNFQQLYPKRFQTCVVSNGDYFKRFLVWIVHFYYFMRTLTLFILYKIKELS